MNRLFLPLLISLSFSRCACGIRLCPDPIRAIKPDGTMDTARIPCDPLPPFTVRPPVTRPTTTAPTGPLFRLTLKVNSLYVINSDDGFWRGCADPLLYPLYARVIPGVTGSTQGRVLPRINFGSNRCSGRLVRKLGGTTTDILPLERVSISAYILIGIEKDDAGDSKVRRQVSRELNKILAVFRQLETENFSPLLARIALAAPSLLDSRLMIPDIEKPSDGFLNLGHDFVGFNAVVLVSGSGFNGQSSACSREAIPICATLRLNKGIIVGGEVDDNKWRANIEVTAT